jgi:hypothetical protein
MSDDWKTVLFLWLALWLGVVFMDIDTRENRKSIDQMQGQVVKLSQQVGELQSRVKFAEVEYGVLWRLYMDRGVKP